MRPVTFALRVYFEYLQYLAASTRSIASIDSEILRILGVWAVLTAEVLRVLGVRAVKVSENWQYRQYKHLKYCNYSRVRAVCTPKHRSKPAYTTEYCYDTTCSISQYETLKYFKYDFTAQNETEKYCEK